MRCGGNGWIWRKRRGRWHLGQHDRNGRHMQDRRRNDVLDWRRRKRSNLGRKGKEPDENKRQSIPIAGQSKAQAMDKGTFSKSQTKTKVTDDGLQSRTKTMSHVPGEKPTKSKTKTLIPCRSPSDCSILLNAC